MAQLDLTPLWKALADSKLAASLPKEDDYIMVPFKAIFAVSDVIVIDETLVV